MSGPDKPLIPEDSLQDPDLDFGEEEELSLEPMLHEPEAPDDDQPNAIPELVDDSFDDTDAMTLAEDANVPLDVEPDPDLPVGTGFEEEISAEQPPPGELDSLRREAAALRAELDTVRQERARSKAVTRRLEQKLETSAPPTELARLEAAVTEAKARAKEAEDEASRLKRELKELSARAETAEAELGEQSQRVPEGAQRELDLLNEKIRALEAENTELKDSLNEIQQAEDRTGQAQETLGRKVTELTEQLRAAESAADEARAEAEGLLKENEALNRELDQSRVELADTRGASDSFEINLKELDDRQAEAATLAESLAQAQQEVQRLQEYEREAQRVEALEDRITELQESLLDKEKEAAEVQEKLDTEAARSYRLSQRRIPALNRELEETQEHTRELERRVQKAELKAETYEGKVKELTDQVADLERALQGAKARAQDTAVIAPGDSNAAELVADEMRRLTNRVREVEAERANLAETFRKIDDGRRTELTKLEARAERIERESDERYESMLKQRTELRVLRERIAGMLRLAEDLSKADHNQGGTLMKAIRKLAEAAGEENAG
jgi:DNA repair exonuclease SbcCD ATPase subunit